uniref:Immunoglobulin domain-containing protein n=1 Tax=Cyprinus carpio TaxID=7962 RepID=A0A8C1TE53_CYPCA
MIFSVLLTLTAFFMSGVSGVDTEKVTLMEGDSVTLQTGVNTIHLEDIKWYFNNTRIAQINGDLSFICTDVQCNEDTERFRDRLKLDHQTGSLTITNINTTDSGVYALKIISSSISEKIFSVTVLDVSAAEEDQTKRKSVKEGEAVTLDTGVIKNTDDVMVWYFNETLIAEITGDQSKICTDDECKERFRDRLKLDHQTGSLTITDTRTTDSGLYKLQINSSSIRRHRRSISITSWKTFTVTVFDVALSSAAVAGICVFVLLLVAAAAGVVYCGRRQTKWNDSRKQCSDQKTHILETANKTLPDGNVTEVANQTLM